MMKLQRQSYGIAMAQVTFGGPQGVWLECSAPGCLESQRCVGGEQHSNADVAVFYRSKGWTGFGPNMKRARCPACVRKRNQAADNAAREASR